MTSWKLNLCKLHNEVFKAAESRINTECLPLVGGDVSQGGTGRETGTGCVCPS